MTTISERQIELATEIFSGNVSTQEKGDAFILEENYYAKDGMSVSVLSFRPFFAARVQ